MSTPLITPARPLVPRSPSALAAAPRRPFRSARALAAPHAPLRWTTALAAGIHLRLLRLRDDRGQGTVEYVALAMLIAAVMAGVVVAAGGLRGGGIAQAVVEKVKAAIGAAGKAPK